MPTITAASLVDFSRSLFAAAGVPDAEADRTALSLVRSNLCGHDSHGVIRIMQYLAALADGRLKAGVDLLVLRETPALVTTNGQWGLGQVQAHRLLDRLIPKAKTIGIGAGTLKHSGHVGRLGEYAERVTGDMLAFLATVNNHGFGRGVAPPGGIEARIGTNPICIGAPTEGEPMVLDVGTSIVAEGKVRVAYNKGIPAPEGWLLDERGQPTTDPGVLYREPRGSIQPLGGAGSHKGFALGMMLDVLIGGLSGGPCSNPERPNLSGNEALFLVFDPSHFAGIEHFMQEAQTLGEAVTTCPRRDDVKEILLPGEPERREHLRREKDGIPLDEGTWGQLCEQAERLHVEPPEAKVY